MSDLKRRQLEQKLYEYTRDKITAGRKSLSVIEAMEKALKLDDKQDKDDDTEEEEWF